MVGFNATALHADTVRVAFGSCADAGQPDHPIWNALYQAQPDALLMIGDNVYADSPEFRSSPSREGLETEYAKLEATPAFQRLRDVVPIYATWDDHDYGLNDGGKEFTLKDVSQQVFFDSWNLCGTVAQQRWIANTGSTTGHALLPLRANPRPTE